MGQDQSVPRRNDGPLTWDELARANRPHFRNNPRLQFLGVEGIDFGGGTLTFRENDENGQEVRKISVKYVDPKSPGAAERLQTEALHLLTLRGAEHIVQIVSLPNSTVNIGGVEHPMMATEHLPYISATQLRDRAANQDRLIPNRVLWHIFRCLVRQIIALENPPNMEGNHPGPFPDLYLETYTGPHPRAMIHDNWRGHNFRFGGNTNPFLDMMSGEHMLVPVLKMTNFGRARLLDLLEGNEEADYHNAHTTNIRNLAWLMETLACNNVPDEEFEKVEICRYTVTNQQLSTRVGPVHEEILTQANQTFLMTPGIDDALKDIVAQCLAVDDKHIPSTIYLIHLANEGVDNRSWQDVTSLGQVQQRLAEPFAGQDAAFVQEFILNADVRGPGESRILGEPDPDADRRRDALGGPGWRDGFH
ncbi:hypothetical protein GGR54DRAFT_654126 [Hypoxylon sp. NC1633]|nr:hypothetical protein GGR54DRAFT_654126 [Hypoxylon sp. NC1633]